ncbi:MAG: TolC family protein [Elusimicrobiaceae bacterium]|nr:TolC family protein [Elusimicrobiaceae bacterium]
MMKKFICLFFFGVFAVPALMAQEPDSPLVQEAQAEAAQALSELGNLNAPLPSLDGMLTVQDCVRIAMANSPSAVSARLAVESAALSLSNARNAFLPTVSAGADAGFSSSHSLGQERINDNSVSSSVGASLSISGITDIGRNIRAQRLQLEQSRMNLCEVENSLVTSVKSAYYALIAAQRAVEIRTKSRDLYQEQYDRTKAFYEQGLRPKVDVTTAEVNLNNENLNLIRAKNLVKTQNAQLANILGVPRDVPFVLDDKIDVEKIEISFEQALSRAYENRPDVQSSKLGLQISEINLTQAKAAYWPTFSLGASFSKSGDEFRFDNDNTRLFAGVEIPIFNALRTYNGVKQAQISLDSAKNSNRSLLNGVYLEVQRAFINLTEAAESIPLAQATVEKARENRELARGRYNEGIGDMLTFKDAEISYTDAELNLLTARFDYAVALAELKQAMGTR